jgi:S1-C subfamily serine protease
MQRRSDEQAAAGESAPSSPPIGTTSGDDVTSSVRTVRFVAATAFPEAWAVVDYGRAQPAWHRPPPDWPQRGEDLLGLDLAPAEDGTRILAVVPGSAADRAGLEPSDVIVRIDSVYGPSPSTTRRILRDKDPGDYAFLRVRRGPHELAVKMRT